MADRRVTFIISANVKNFTKGLGAARKQFGEFSKSMTNVGKRMTMFVTAPLVGAGTAAIKLATDFETSMSKIVGLVGVAASEVNAMRSEVLALSGETARAPQELADALFFVTSAGLRGKDAMEVLESSAKAAAAGLGETKVVADLVTSAVNAYGITNLSAGKATDILVAAVREGKAEADKLAESMGQVLPIASNMGVSFDQVGAAIAGMTRTGTNAQTAAVQLRQILASLLQPSVAAEDALKRMGTSSAELRKSIRENGLLSVLGFLRQQMNTNEQAMSEVFGNIRALSGALDLMGANAEDNIGIFSRMTDTTGSLNAAFNTAANTTGFKFKQALAELQKTAIELGNILIPVFTKLLEHVRQVVRWFSGLSSEAKNLTVFIFGLVAALGPALTILGTVGTVLAGISLPIAGVIAGIAALGAAFIYLSENWEAVKERISDWGWWRNALIDMAQFFIEYSPISLFIKGYQELAKLVGIDLPNPFTDMANALEGLKGETKDYEHEFGSFTEAIAAKWEKVKTSLLNLSSNVGLGGGGSISGEAVQTAQTVPLLNLPPGEVFDEYLEDFEKMHIAIDQTTQKTSLLNEVFSTLGDIGRNAFSGMTNVISDAFNGTTGILEGFKKFFFNFIKGMVAKLIAATIAALALAAVLSAIPGLGGAGAFQGIKKATSFGGKFAAGLKSVAGLESGGVVPSGFPNDTYPAFLSSGETVLPSPKSLPSSMNQPIKVTGVLRAQGDELLAVIEEAEYQRGNTN